MKKILLLLTVMLGALTAHADESAYSYLTFETTDGNKASVPVESLTIAIADTELTVGDQTFTLSNLSKMYFTATDMTSGISPVVVTDITEVYDLNGRRVSREQMQQGVYIVKTKRGTYKLIAR